MRAVVAFVAGLSLGGCSLLSLSDLGGGTLDAGVQSVVDAPNPGQSGSDSDTTSTETSGGSGSAASADPDAGSVALDSTTSPPPPDSNVAIDATVPIPFVDTGAPMEAAPPVVDSAPGCSANVATDPSNCGVCGHNCQGGACASGQCQPLTLATTSGSVGIAVDSTFVYWADSDAGAIYKINKSLTRLGTPTLVVSGTVAQSVQGLASDGTYIYWTNKTTSGQVRRALPTGAALTTIATNQSQPDWIASNGATVVWSNQTGNQIMSAPANSDGGIRPTQLNVSGENGTTPAGIAIDGTNVYYASKISGGGLAESVPLLGGPVRELGTGTYVSMTIDDNNAYWGGGAANPSVYQNSKTGTPVTEKVVASGALVCPLGVASDGTNIYFLDQGTASCGPIGSDAGAIYRIPVGNGGTLPPPVAHGIVDPQGMTIDGSAVYWVTGGPIGAVMKLAK